MKRSERFLNALLQRRLKAGKEDPARMNERRGVTDKPRPKGCLIWLHAASVGEAQSALILINALVERNPAVHVLVTTVTLTSAKRMADSLPKQAFHQFAPLDHPDWAQAFLDHWQPDAALWMESELWPNMLLQIKERKIPAALINARLSDRSFSRWSLLKSSMRRLLEAFNLVITQTPRDQARFETLGAAHVQTSGNLKYSAAPLLYNEDDLKKLVVYIGNREICVYASTHKGEEALIMRAHQILEASRPEFLSIIIPRHPERGEEIEALAQSMNLRCVRRSQNGGAPQRDTQIYIADTLGELGLFYRLSPLVYIGRSMSDDGGGGHNPIEAAQLNCAILHGAQTQNLQDIYDDISAADASILVRDETELVDALRDVLEAPEKAADFAAKALHFSKTQSHVINHVLDALNPLLSDIGITNPESKPESKKAAKE